MIEETQERLDAQSGPRLARELEEALIGVESGLVQTSSSIASVRGLLHELVTYIMAAANTGAPAVPSPSPGGSRDAAAHVESEPSRDRDAAEESHGGVGEKHFSKAVSEDDARFEEELRAKIDAKAMLSKVDERLRRLRHSGPALTGDGADDPRRDDPGGTRETRD